MASATLLRSIRRRDVVSAPLSLCKSLITNGQPSRGSQTYASFCRALSSRPFGNEVFANGLDTITEGKNRKAVDNAVGAQITPSFLFHQKREFVMGPPSFGTKCLSSTKAVNPQIREEQNSSGTKRLFSTQAVDQQSQEDQYSTKKQAFRPLSPHLPVYKPQMNSMLSIFNRISGVYLSGVVVFGYLIYMKMGLICLTYPSFYQFLFIAQKQVPVITSVTALAMFYHTVVGTHALMTHAKPFPKLFR